MLVFRNLKSDNLQLQVVSLEDHYASCFVIPKHSPLKSMLNEGNFLCFCIAQLS